MCAVIQVVDAESGAVYDLQMLRAPALGGTLLWIFTWVVESWIYRYILAPKLMRDSGLPQVPPSSLQLPT